MDLNRNKQKGCSVSGEELATLAGLTTKTLNKYVKLGLLPSPIRTGAGNKAGNRNYFPAEAIERLMYIQRQRQEGYSLEQIITGRTPAPLIKHFWVYPSGDLYQTDSSRRKGCKR